MDIQDDPLYRDLREGYLTESSDGATALWEILAFVVIVPIALIVRGVRWLIAR